MKLFLGVIGSADCNWKSCAERSTGDAIFCDYGSDIAVGSYVEGDVRGADVWGGPYAGCVRDFCWGALFNGDLIAAREREINC